LIEAMALRVPVVALGTTAVPGTVGDAGLVWEENDPYLLAESIHQVTQDETLSAALGYAGWKRYQQQFANAQIEKRFLSLLNGVGCLN
jgi:glycosyltransferase involved in cell wall biosynthesis